MEYKLVVRAVSACIVPDYLPGPLAQAVLLRAVGTENG